MKIRGCEQFKFIRNVCTDPGYLPTTKSLKEWYKARAYNRDLRYRDLRRPCIISHQYVVVFIVLEEKLFSTDTV